MPFERVAAHRAAVSLAHYLFPRAQAWPAFARFTIGQQLVRAAESVGANIAEMCGRANAPDQLRFLHIARGSLYETRHWVARAQQEGLLDGGVEPLLEEAGKTLAGLIRYRTERRVAK